MITSNLNQLELSAFHSASSSDQRCEATFPLFAPHGTIQLATVYFELEPGARLGRHTDSAEELLIVLDGKIQATISDETRTMNALEIAVVPKMAPHDLKNVGPTKARVLGVFAGGNNIVATFDDEWLPTHSKVVDTRLLAGA